MVTCGARHLSKWTINWVKGTILNFVAAGKVDRHFSEQHTIT